MGIKGILEVPGDCEFGLWNLSAGSSVHLLCHKLIQGARWKGSVSLDLKTCALHQRVALGQNNQRAFYFTFSLSITTRLCIWNEHCAVLRILGDTAWFSCWPWYQGQTLSWRSCPWACLTNLCLDRDHHLEIDGETLNGIIDKLVHQQAH